MEFKNRINELLAKKNLKQADLCRMTGLTTAIMSNYSTGKVSPTLENAIKIADALDITLDELVGRNKNDYLTQEEEMLIGNIRELPTADQQKIFEYAEMLNAKNFQQRKLLSGAG